MSQSLMEISRNLLGARFFVDLRVREETNSDDLEVVWLDIVYQGLTEGPDNAVVSQIVDAAWEAYSAEDVTPIVSFVSLDEDQPLAAAE
ncbi:hypothetical protein HKCCE4037_04275 [Rhodobacterales bacterium HKCCE4037]|nr:hypothetical protein [Rhodobacterales bacterium HKCCE4037]